MENTKNQQRTRKNRKHSKSKKPSWKIINEIESTSDQDSEGTTGSIGGNRTRDSSACSSSLGDRNGQKQIIVEKFNIIDHAGNNQFWCYSTSIRENSE